jgi:hypothetical protein
LVHLVTYDLKSPNDDPEDYARVIEGLKSLYPTWCHVEKSVWLVETEQAASEVRDALKLLLRPSDVLLVVRLSGNWGSVNLGTKRSEWLKERTF